MRASRFFSALIALGLITGPAWAALFETGKKASGNNVKFEVSAPLETIVGNTAGVSGYFDFDPNHVTASTGARFEVDVTSFYTGIALRDEHFRDNFLHTKKYPTAVFILDKILSASQDTVQSGESVEVELEGTLYLHGVEQTMGAVATVTYIEGSEATQSMLPGNIVAINAHFRIVLADYNIERAEVLMLRVGDEVDITLFSRLTDAPQMSAGSCGGCDGGGGCDGCGGCGGCDGCGGE